MGNIVNAVSDLIRSLLTNAFGSFLKRPKKAKGRTVYLPKLIAVVGVFGSVFFLIPTLITAFSDEPIWLPISFFLFFLLCVALIVAFLNCRITYDDNGFTVKNFFGRKQRYTYRQITAIQGGVPKGDLCIGKRKIRIDESAVGRIDFIRFADRQYRILHDEMAIPEYRSDHDLFNGHVKNATELIIAYILVGTITVGLLIFSVVYVYCMPDHEANTDSRQVCFTTCTLQKDTLIMTSTEDQIYKIQFSGDQVDIQKIKAVCDGETIVTAYTKNVAVKGEDPYFSVKAIRCDGDYIFSFEESNQLRQKAYRTTIVFAGVLNLAWFAYVAGSITVGKDPQRFSEKTIRLFFKDGYVRY